MTRKQNRGVARRLCRDLDAISRAIEPIATRWWWWLDVARGVAVERALTAVPMLRGRA